jgi:hypothetical protein
MCFSPFPCYLVPLRPKYSPKHPILKHPVYDPRSMWYSKFHTHTKLKSAITAPKPETVKISPQSRTSFL